MAAHPAVAVALADERATVPAVGEHAALTDQRRDLRVPGVDLVEDHIDEGDTGIAGHGIAEESMDPRPDAVGADDQIGVDSNAAGELESVSAGAQLYRGDQFVSPAHGCR